MHETAEIKRRTFKSLKWTGILAGFNLLSSFVFKLALARFLTPSDFGQLSIAMAAMIITEIFSSLGISQAVTAKQITNRPQLTAMFLANIAASAIFIGSLIFLAPYLKQFFKMARLSQLLYIVAPTVMGLTILRFFISLMARELRADIVSQIQIARNLTVILVSLGLLSMGTGVEAVLWAHLTAVWLWLIPTYVVVLRQGGLPFCMQIDMLAVFRIFKFSGTVWTKELINEAAVRIDEILIGSLLRPEVLGFYYFGKSLIESLRRLISSSFAQVMLPLFAKTSNDNIALSRIYDNIAFSVALFATPLFAMCGITAHLYVPLLFGNEWQPAVVVIQIFSGAMVIKVLTANVSTYLLYVKNRQRMVLLIDLILSSLYFIVLFYAAPFGLVAVTFTYLIYIYSKNLILQYYAVRSIGSNLYNFIYNIRHPICLSLLLLTLVLGFLLMLPGDRLIAVRIIGCVALAVVASSFYYLHFERERALGLMRSFLRL